MKSYVMLLCVMMPLKSQRYEVLKILFEANITLSENLILPFLDCEVTFEIYRMFINYGWNVNSHTDKILRH